MLGHFSQFFLIFGYFFRILNHHGHFYRFFWIFRRFGEDFGRILGGFGEDFSMIFGDLFEKR